MFDLTNKTVLITGATGGIGLGIAKILHQAGATLMLTGTRASKLAEIQKDFSERVHIMACDLADSAQLEELIPQTEAQLGSLDILVNNAGITRDGLMMRMKDHDWSELLDINLTASFKLCRAAMRGMMKRRWGRIVTISSIVGVSGNAGQANYAATKAGLIGMSKSMAQELASRNITVNCIAPGFIATPMTDVLNDKQRGALLEKIPVGRLGSPDDIAYAVLYLVSNESDYVTGQTLHVNGGMIMP